jgi:selenide,water dikinase
VVAALWHALQQPQGNAARLLSPVARAMTDVTGFGLAGHLDEMLRAGGLGAELDLTALPCFAGAEDLAARGIASTIAPANRAALLGRISAPPTPRAALLFDPQTAGGFLAAVPAAETSGLVSRLQDLGHAAACIGRFTALPDTGPALRVT